MRTAQLSLAGVSTSPFRLVGDLFTQNWKDTFVTHGHFVTEFLSYYRTRPYQGRAEVDGNATGESLSIKCCLMGGVF